MVDLRVNTRNQSDHSALFVASSQLLAHLCYLLLTFIFIATFHQHYAFTTSYVLFGKLSLFANYAMQMKPKYLKTAANKIQRRQLVRSGISPGVSSNKRNSCPWLLKIRLTIFYGSFKGLSPLPTWPQCPHSGFKLATSTFLLSILDVYLYQHIPQALR